jgi:hypothetical protein
MDKITWMVVELAKKEAVAFVSRHKNGVNQRLRHATKYGKDATHEIVSTPATTMSL